MKSNSQKNCNGENQLPELILSLREKLQEATEENDLNYLQNIRSDDEFLAKFLRTRRCNLERAYKSVLNYYQCINRYYGDIVSDPNTTSAYVVPVFNANFFKRLNITASKSNSATIHLNIQAWDTNKFTIYNLQQAAAFLFEDLSQQIEVQLNGCSVIMDFQGLSFKHLRQLTSTEVKRGIYTLQDGIPIRIIGIHVINYPAIFWGLYNIGKIFIKEKMKKRIHFHPTLESLYEYFNKEKMPISLGGPLEDDDLTENNAMVNHFMLRNISWKEHFTPMKQNL